MKSKLLPILVILLLLLPVTALTQSTGGLYSWLINDPAPKLSENLVANGKNITGVNVLSGTGAFSTTSTLRGHGVTSMATYTVAASDSSDKDIANSDYQCNGTDDHVQIESAMNALPAAGGTVVLCAGNYLAEQIEIPSGTTLSGVGMGTVLKQEDGDDCRFIVQDGWTTVSTNSPTAENITLQDMKIDGNSGNMSAVGDTDEQSNSGCVEFQQTTNLLIQGLLIEDPWATGIELTYCTGAKVVNNTIRRSADDGIAVNKLCKQVLVIGNVIEDVAENKYIGGPVGIEVQDGASFVVIEGNTISYTGYVPSNVIVGIDVGSHADIVGTHHVTVSNNSIHSSVAKMSSFIAIKGASDVLPIEYVVVTGNSLQSDCTPDSSRHTKVSITNVNNVSVTDNVSEGMVYSGVVSVWLSGTQSNVIISNNMFAGDRYGVKVSSTAALEKILINGNRFGFDGQWMSFTTATVDDQPTLADVSITNNMLVSEDGAWYTFRFSAYMPTFTRCEFSGNRSLPFNRPFLYYPADSDISAWDIYDNANYNTPTVTLATADITTFAATGDRMIIAGHADGNIIATITGRIKGQTLRLKFTNDKVTISDGTGANQINLSAIFESAANTTLVLEDNGIGWDELSRSVN